MARRAKATSDGSPVIDPTKNVLDLVAAAIQRQDNLREAESRHVREIIEIRAAHAEQMRVIEAARIDAIRSVDVGAVQRATEVSTQQATTLASQVGLSAEAVRIGLAAALEPIQKDIADLRRVQYEQAGQKAQVVESRVDRRSDTGLYLLAASVIIAAISVVVAILASRPPG